MSSLLDILKTLVEVAERALGMGSTVTKEKVERRSRAAGYANDISHCLTALGNAKAENDARSISARCGELSGHLRLFVKSLEGIIPPEDLRHYMETLVGAHVARALAGLQHEESVQTILDASGRFAALASALRGS